MRPQARADALLPWGVAIVAGAIGLALRLWHIGATPMWLDEAYSAYAADHGFAFLWQVVPRYETHPPFYYSLLRLWTLAFGDGLLAERALGLTAGLLTPPMIAWSGAAAAAWLGWPAAQRRAAAIAAFALACTSIPLVEMTREVRPYPLMILVYAVALRALIAVLARRADGRPLPGPAYFAYCVALGLILWLHNLGPFWAAAMGLALLVAFFARPARRTDWGWLVAGHAAVLILWLPALGILADQAPTWAHSTWLVFSFDGLWEHLLVLYAVPGWQALSALVLAGLALGALLRHANGRRLAAMLLLLAIVPAALSVTISATWVPVFISRTMTPVAVPTILLLALGATAYVRPIAWVGWAAAVILAANQAGVGLQTRLGPPMQDWYPAVRWLEARWRPGDLILAYPNEGALPLQRALKDRGFAWPVKPVPTAVPAPDEADGWHPTGSRGVISLPRARLETIARQGDIAKVRKVWLLRLGATTYDRGDLFLTALRRDRRPTERYLAVPIDIIGLEKR